MKVLAAKKARITVNAIHSTGIPLCQDQVFLADSRLLETPIAAFRAIELRIVVPTHTAEDFHNALSTGDVEILIQDIPPKV